MKNITKKWTTIIESVVVMVIITIWIIWMFEIYMSSMKFADSTWNRIQAISIAKEWLEAVTNIRDTNWILFLADTNNCWMVKDYDSSCISNSGKNFTTWSYIVYKDTDDRWYLSWRTTNWWDYANSTYRNEYRVFIDSNWLYNQTWTTVTKPLFTREIALSYSWTWTAFVKSIVNWADPAKTDWSHQIILETTLTNWIKN